MGEGQGRCHRVGGLGTRPGKGVRSLRQSRQTHSMNRVMEGQKDSECE